MTALPTFWVDFPILDSHCSKTAVLDWLLFLYLILDITLNFMFYVITRRLSSLKVRTIDTYIYTSLTYLKTKQEKENTTHVNNKNGMLMESGGKK